MVADPAATGAAFLVIVRKGKARVEETVTPNAAGRFVSSSVVRRGETATITLADGWATPAARLA